MPYIGNQDPAGFNAAIKDRFSGNNSTTAFTLSRAVANVNDLQIFVDNVRQEPTIAYSVSGSTLTFTEAPPTGTNNVYVVHTSSVGATILPPQDLGTTDYIFGDDISLKSDSAVLNFGADSEVKLTHVHNSGITLTGGSYQTTTAGDDNVVIGQNAGTNIASGGDDNVLIGRDAGDAITTGDQNVAVGFEALSTEDAHGQNVAVGYRALKTLNAGAEGLNTAVGHNAGVSVTTGIKNTFIGNAAGDATDDGASNTAVGYLALSANCADDNTAIGESSLEACTGSGNTAVGRRAGEAITSGSNNVAIGLNALKTEDTDSGNVAVGQSAMENANGSNVQSVAVGFEALHNLTTGGGCTAVGYQAGEALSTAVGCTFVGQLAGTDVTGNDNTAVGTQALYTETSGVDNVAIGHDALRTSNGGSGNTAVGSHAGNDITSGTQNTFVGNYAGDGGDDPSYCTAIGYAAMGNANFGNGNTSIGWSSGFAITGINNTMLGNAAGYAVTSGGNNICIGLDAGRTGSPGGNITSGSNEIALGDENISSFSCQTSLTATSDERDKTDFKDLDLGLNFVNALKPVTYVWDKRTNYIDKTDVTTYDKDGEPVHKGWDLTTDLDKIVSDGSKKDDDLQVGFKAQDVIALEDAAGYKLSDKTNLLATITSDGKQYGLRYERFVPMLVKALQELSAKNDALEARIKKLEDG